LLFRNGSGLADVVAVCEAGQWEIDGALYPQGYVFGADIGHGSTHGVGFYECQRARGGREYVMRGAPVPRHQLQRIRDARQEDEAYREESDHQQRSVRIGKKDAASPKKDVANRYGIISMTIS